MNSDLLLASQSSRRIDYLKQLNVQFQSVASDLVEKIDLSLPPESGVELLAKQKALAVFEREQKNDQRLVPILAADTLVFLEGRPLGKPESVEKAAETLRRLSGQTHEVITALAMLLPQEADQTHAWRTRVSTTKVTFTKLSDSLIRNYCLTGEPKGKAGAYAIQGLGQAFVSHIEGCYSTVVGLPLPQLIELFDEVGIHHLFTQVTEVSGPFK